eukprot:3811189-Alexandrium_andersonii.AAC.1
MPVPKARAIRVEQELCATRQRSDGISGCPCRGGTRPSGAGQQGHSRGGREGCVQAMSILAGCGARGFPAL